MAAQAALTFQSEDTSSSHPSLGLIRCLEAELGQMVIPHTHKVAPLPVPGVQREQGAELGYRECRGEEIGYRESRVLGYRENVFAVFAGQHVMQ